MADDKLDKLLKIVTDEAEKNKLFRKDYQEMQDDLKSLRKDLAKFMQKVNHLQHSHNQLRSEVIDLSETVVQLQQAPLASNVIIHGIPEQPEENLPDIIDALFLKIESEDPVDPSGFLNISRIGKVVENKCRPILLQLESPNIRADMLKKKRAKSITAADLVVNGKKIGRKDNQIFMSEHLGKLSGKIFYHARRLKLQKKIHSSWVRNGEVYIRVREGEQHLKISHISQLARFTKNGREEGPSLDMDDFEICDLQLADKNTKNAIGINSNAVVQQPSATLPAPAGARGLRNKVK